MTFKGNILDCVGIILSSCCFVHCIAAPVLMIYLAVFSETTELILIISATAVGIFSLLPSYRRHRRVKPILLFCLGLVLLFSSHMIFHDEQEELSPLLIACGALSVAFAHLFNIKSCRCSFCHTQSKNVISL